MSFTHRDRTLNKIAVIGSGQIGPDIALHFSKVLSPHGVQIVVVDIAEEALAKGQAKLEKKVAKGVETGAFSPEQQAQMVGAVTFTADYDQVKGADFVVEAATEDKGLKGRIFGQIAGLVDEGAILASNSSHLEPEVIFADLPTKGRSTVIHYFFPAERNPVVEVVPGAETDAALTDWLLSFYEAIGKVPIQVKSRYGYALDPVFEGLFQAAAMIAEAGVATTKEIDWVQRKALGMTVGSFTAMNLTGGNPITAVGLDNYTTKINPWFRTVDSLKQKVETGDKWDVPGRGEKVEVEAAKAKEITELIQGAYFGLCGEIIDAGLCSVADFDMAVEIALDMKPAFRFMNEQGTAEALRLVQKFQARFSDFYVPECIAALGKDNTPFQIPVVLRKDVDGVAVLTIRRPKVLNALDQGVFREIQDRVAEADADSKVDAIVITGFGVKAFVSGADVNFLARIETVEQGVETSATSQACLNAIEDANKPVVCALNGLAFGGGIELAMACNARIARSGLKVLAGQPEANLGIIPGAGGTQRLPRWIGIEAAAQMIRSTRPVSSAKALELGLIQEEVDGDLVGRAVELAKGMATGSVPTPEITREPMAEVPASLPEQDLGHLSKAVDAILCKAILDGAKRPLRDAIAFEAQCFGEVCGTEDMKIGVRNFIENGPRSKAPFVHK